MPGAAVESGDHRAGGGGDTPRLAVTRRRRKRHHECPIGCAACSRAGNGLKIASGFGISRAVVWVAVGSLRRACGRCVARGPDSERTALRTVDDMAEPFQLPSDRELVAATRAGSDQAWGELGSRHRDAVAAVARARDRRGADQAADEALAALREEIRNDSVDAASTDFAVRAVRPRALVCLTGGTYAPTAAETSTAVDQPSSSTVRPARTGGEEPDAPMPAADTGADLAVLAVAFGRLSEPWQTVLWHRLVESEPAASLTAMPGGARPR